MAITGEQGKGLTDARLLELSSQLDIDELLTLGIKGLGISDRIIDRHIKNHPNDMSKAVYSTLKEWRRSQDNATVAYQNICKALRDVEMPYYVHAALQ